MHEYPEGALPIAGDGIEAKLEEAHSQGEAASDQALQGDLIQKQKGSLESNSTVSALLQAQQQGTKDNANPAQVRIISYNHVHSRSYQACRISLLSPYRLQMSYSVENARRSDRR